MRTHLLQSAALCAALLMAAPASATPLTFNSPNVPLSDATRADWLAAIIRSGAGSIHDSNAIGSFALTQNELAFLDLDFPANPVDYVGFRDIDQTGSAFFSFENTLASEDPAEFLARFRSDKPPIIKVQLDSSRDGRWGINNQAYGRSAGVIPESGTLVLLWLGILCIGLGLLDAGLMGLMRHRFYR